MKQVSVDNLRENDILALPILSQADAVLIHADVPMTTELISRIRNLGTRTVYIRMTKKAFYQIVHQIMRKRNIHTR